VGTVYFHSPCFDGIASAVLAAGFLEAQRHWPRVTLRAVNYDVRATWLATALPDPSAVVDFLYHPDARFWADHHQTAFLDDRVRQHYEARQRPDLIYDASASSCAALLSKRLAESYEYRNAARDELVAWADKIDAARYGSVEEAILPSTDALRLNLSLVSASPEFCEFLAQELQTRSIEDLATAPQVRQRWEHAQRLLAMGLTRFKDNARVERDGIVVFDVTTEGTIVSRYAPYYFFPEARYSVGIIRSDHDVKVTAMRNPWKEFHSVPLGQVAAQLGGGGHQRVGSVLLRGEHAARATAVVQQFVAEIRRLEATTRPPSR
jgi:hypothetical protein